ncbi:MAG: hypothetical protein JNN28_04270 [Saprospiraceae bacterium]|nr:hypothetical protein [Saprospiraceae bacterium]
MATSKVLEIAGKFTPEEKSSFRLFIKSPFFVPETNATLLTQYFDFLMETTGKSGQTNQTLEKAKLHAYLFPDKPFSASRLEKITIKLRETLEHFLATRYYHREENSLQRGLDFISMLRSKRLDGLYERQMQKLKSEIQIQSLESTERYHFQYLVYREEHEWKSMVNTWQNDLSIPDTIQQLDLFYFTERVELLNRLLLQGEVMHETKINVSALGLDLPTYFDVYEAQSPLLAIRRKIQVLFLHNNPTKQDFEYFLQFLKAQEQFLTNETIRELHTYLRNICTLRANHTANEDEKLNLYEVLHQIHKENLEKGYLYHNGFIQPYAVLNIIKIALKINKKEWTKAFIDKHKDLIQTADSAIDHYHYCLAMYFFADKQYETSLAYLPFHTTAPFLMLITRRLELMNLYELQSDLLLYKIDAFRKYLERTVTKSMSNSERESNLKFTKLLRQLVLSKPDDKHRSIQLENRIKTQNRIVDSLWLLEKVRNMKK